MRSLAHHLVLFIVLVIISACGPSADFKSYTVKLPPKPPTAPVGIYPPGYTLPPHANVIGEIRISSGGMGRDCEREDTYEKAREKAREVGADAVQIIEITPPINRGDCWGLRGFAFTLQPPLGFPTHPATDSSVRARLDAIPGRPPGIEGIWRIDVARIWRQRGRDPEVDRKDDAYRLAFVPAADSRTYDFVGVVTVAAEPGWAPGMVKARLSVTEDPNTFVGTWYSADFKPDSIVITRDKEVRMQSTIEATLGEYSIEHRLTLFRVYPSLSSP